MGNKISIRKDKEIENKKEFIICRRASRLFHNGNSIMALRLMDDACRKNTSSGLLCRAYADLCAKIVSSTNDFTIKIQFLHKALNLCKKGVVLLPNSIEFYEFYVKLLFYNGYHEDVVQEGQRGLAISTPTDPAEEDWTDGKADFGYPWSRIHNLRSSIENLIDESSKICLQVSDLVSDEDNCLLNIYNKVIADATAEKEERTRQRRLQEIEGPMDAGMRVMEIEQPPRLVIEGPIDAGMRVMEIEQPPRLVIEGPMDAGMRLSETEQPPKTLGERILGLNEDCLRILLLKIGPVGVIEDCPFLDPVINLGLESQLYETLDLRNVTRRRTADELMLRGLGFIRKLYLGEFIGIDSFFISNRASFSSIRTLKLWCCKDLSSRVLIDTLPHLTELESFHTCECRISEPIIYQLSQSSPKLSEFSIYCGYMRDSGLDALWCDDVDILLHEYIDWMCNHLGGRQITKIAIRGFEICKFDVQSVLTTFPSLIELDLGVMLILQIGEDDVFNRIDEYVRPAPRNHVVVAEAINELMQDDDDLT